MELFKRTTREKTSSDSMEKVAVGTNYAKLSENSENWSDEIYDQAVKQLPTLAAQKMFVDLDIADDIRGFGKGELIVNGKFTVPFFISEFMLSPLDLVVQNNKVYSASKKRLMELVLQDRFQLREAGKEEEKLISLNTSKPSPSLGGGESGNFIQDTTYDNKMAGDFHFVLEDPGPSSSEYIVNSMDKYTKSHGMKMVNKFACGPLFQSFNVSPEKARNILSKDGMLSLTHQDKVADVVDVGEKLASNRITKSGAHRVYSIDNDKAYDGVYITKIASPSDQEFKNRQLFLSSNGEYSIDQNIYGSSIPLDGERFYDKVAGEDIKKGKRGVLVFEYMGEKLAFGPFIVTNRPSKVTGKIAFDIASGDGTNMKIKLDPNKNRAVYLPSLNTTIFPSKVAFVPINSRLKLATDNEKHHTNGDRLIEVSSDGVEYILKVADGKGGMKKKRLNNRAQVLNELHDDGLSAARSELMNGSDLKKYTFLGKAVDKITGKSMNKTENITLKGPRIGEERDGDNPVTKSAGEHLISTLIDKLAYGYKLSEAEMSKVASIYDDHVIMVKTAMLSLDDIIPEDRKTDNIHKYFEYIPHIEKVENALGNLLMEVRSGSQKFPENSLMNAMRNIGVVKDALVIMQQTDSV